MSKRIRLGEYAKKMCISRMTALRWFHDGKLPHPAQKISERIILVEVPDDFDGPVAENDSTPGKTVGYARVSTRKQEDSLPHQKLAILEYANKNNIIVDKIYEEIGSGFNENRRKLSQILSDPTITTIIVEHKDRLARSNFNLLKKTLESQNREIIVIENDELDDDLVTEITEFMVSAAGRLYGKRGAERVRKNLEKTQEELSHE